MNTHESLSPYSDRPLLSGAGALGGEIIYSMPTLIRHAERAGSYFFTPSAMHWFNSRTLGAVYGNRYFVTSERFENDPRAYTVREFLFAEQRRDDGRIILTVEIGTAEGFTFQQFSTRGHALVAALNAAATQRAAEIPAAQVSA